MTTERKQLTANEIVMQKAFGLLIQKFPFMENLPGDPSDFVAIKVDLKEVFVTDNTISFAHTEKVTFPD